MLRHFALHFPSNSGGIACWMAELNAVLCIDTFPRIGIEPTTSRVYSHTLVPLRHNWPHINIYDIYIFLWEHSIFLAGVIHIFNSIRIRNRWLRIETRISQIANFTAVAVVAQACDCNATAVSSIPTLVPRRHWVPSLNTWNAAKIQRKRGTSVLIIGSLCLPFYMRVT